LRIEPQAHIAGPIPIVDLFAGPGGLGEGFSSVDGDPFKIIVSAEMTAPAHRTLHLRAFYRLLKRRGGSALDSYYRYCNEDQKLPYDNTNKDAWDEAGEEARQLELGVATDNDELDQRISAHDLGPGTPWVLIGGPPCQAYSLGGRSRNRGKIEYRAEDDHRHFLYKEYLRIIQKYRPAVFVMENVKGILTAKVGGKKIFDTILRDLSDPDAAMHLDGSGSGYRIHSLTCKTSFSTKDVPRKINVQDFVVRAENHGIPQARHRVILIGVRDDIGLGVPGQIETCDPVSVERESCYWPLLRSRLSKESDSNQAWGEIVAGQFREMSHEVRGDVSKADLYMILEETSKQILMGLGVGSDRLVKHTTNAEDLQLLGGWYHDPRLKVWLNHDARGHMRADLRRYAYAAAFAKAYGRAPKGHAEFSLKDLRPNHKNWETGKFSDRFRVQLDKKPATTITSHISKDGHYFIHPDPRQCRSLTVREAARLQTFPDNYFFEGNRTEQFHQVGNAVPPLLAKKIADIVLTLLNSASDDNPVEKQGALQFG
jgi:DNA (cytosine-5)-methyltransferase 1